MTISRGQKSIGMSTSTPPPPSLPNFVVDPYTHIRDLETRLQNMEVLVERKADANRLPSLIAISDDTVLIQGRKIGLFGEVTLMDVVLDQNGTQSGRVHPSFTRIVGDKIQTGTIYSNNWGDSAGSRFDLNNGTLEMGGSVSPKFRYADGDLTISGTLTADTIVLTGDSTTTGMTISELAAAAVSEFTEEDLQNILDAGVGNIIAGTSGDYGLEVTGTSVIAKHNLANPAGLGGGYSGDLRTGILLSATGLGMGYNRKSDGAWINAISINASGDVAYSGALSGATGTFTGSLSGATGTFSGTLSAATGTFAGSISAATGTFTGAIEGTHVLATGSQTVPGYNNFAIVADPGDFFAGGVFGSSVSAEAARFQTSNGTALQLEVFSAGGDGDALEITNPTNGYSINVLSGKSRFNGTVTMLSTLSVSSSISCGALSASTGAFSGNVSTAGGISMTSATQNLVVGNATSTGQANVCIKQGAAGAKTSGQIEVYGANSSGSKTTLGMVVYEDVVAGTGPLSGIANQIKIMVNAVEYWLPLVPV